MSDQSRRQFLGAAAVLTALPLPSAAGQPDSPERNAEDSPVLEAAPWAFISDGTFDVRYFQENPDREQFPAELNVIASLDHVSIGVIEGEPPHNAEIGLDVPPETAERLADLLVEKAEQVREMEAKYNE